VSPLTPSGLPPIRNDFSPLVGRRLFLSGRTPRLCVLRAIPFFYTTMASAFQCFLVLLLQRKDGCKPSGSRRCLCLSDDRGVTVPSTIGALKMVFPPPEDVIVFFKSPDSFASNTWAAPQTRFFLLALRHCAWSVEIRVSFPMRVLLCYRVP